MSAAKITISLSQEVLQTLDQLVQSRTFSSRSQFIQVALQEKLGRLKRTRLVRECAKLDIQEEQAMADVGLALDMESWPPY